MARKREVATEIIADDQCSVKLGETVWCNSMSGSSKPAKCVLIGVNWRGPDGQDSWPWKVRYIDQAGKSHTYDWAHVYASEENARKAEHEQSFRSRLVDPLLRALQHADRLFDRHGFQQIRGQAWTDSDRDVIQAAIAKAEQS